MLLQSVFFTPAGASFSPLLTGLKPANSLAKPPNITAPQSLPEDTFTPISLQSRAGGLWEDIFVKLWLIIEAEKDLKKALKNYLEAINKLELEDYKKARQVEQRHVEESTKRIIQWIREKEYRPGDLTSCFQLLNMFINRDITDGEKKESLLTLLAVLESKQQALRALIQPQNED